MGVFLGGASCHAHCHAHRGPARVARVAWALGARAGEACGIAALHACCGSNKDNPWCGVVWCGVVWRQRPCHTAGPHSGRGGRTVPTCPTKAPRKLPLVWMFPMHLNVTAAATHLHCWHAPSGCKTGMGTSLPTAVPSRRRPSPRARSTPPASTTSPPTPPSTRTSPPAPTRHVPAASMVPRSAQAPGGCVRGGLSWFRGRGTRLPTGLRVGPRRCTQQHHDSLC